MSRELKELRIKLKNDQSNIKGVILKLDNGNMVNVELDDFKIYTEILPGDIFTINLSRLNHMDKNKLERVMNLYSENIYKASKITLLLDYNNIVNSEFIDIVDFLFHYRDKLYKIDITHNNIKRTGFECLIRLLELCPLFFSLECDKNFITEKMFYDILDNSKLPRVLKDNLVYSAF